MALGSSVGISGDTAVPVDVDRVEKGKGKKGKSKGGPKGKDKSKGDQKGKASGKKGADNGKGYGNQRSWVQDRLHGRAAHGVQLTTTMGRVANLAKVEKVRIVARAKILRVTSAENMVTLHVIAGCVQLDRMTTQLHRLEKRPIQGAIQQTAL